MNRDELQQRIQEAAQAFTDQVMAAFGEALQSFVSDLTEGVPQSLSTSGASGGGTAKSTRAKGASKRATAPQGNKRKKGRSRRRTMNEIEMMADRVEKLLRERKEKLRMEQINEALGTTTKEMMRPMKKLLDDKRIKREGERRATVYFVD